MDTINTINVGGIDKEIEDTVARAAGEDADSRLDILEPKVNTEISNRTSGDAALQTQIDQIVAPTGTAPNPAEIENARIGANGKTYTTLGNAIREQMSSTEKVIGSIDAYKRNINLNMPIGYCDDAFDIVDDSGNIIAKIDRYGHIHSGDFNSHKAVIQDMLYTVKRYDWAIRDEDGNVVFAIKDQKTIINNKLYGKKISILGDSISTYSGYIPSGYAVYYPHGDVDNVDETWWKQVIDYLGLELLTNASWSGSRVSGNSQGTATCGCSDARIADLKGPNNEDPDIILCYIATNDWAHDVALGTFDSHEALPSEGTISNIADAYALMLYKIRTTYPKAVVYCMTELEGRHTADDTSYPVENANGTTIHEVNHTITEIAHNFGAKVIDLNTCGIHYWNVADYTVDSHLHPNVNGMIAIKNAVIDTLLSTYNDLA